uniref:Uncharacterized protein n=1 Tax=Acrobeloides nanus TaxID=290746 RepID=A0A914ENG5_9BILA
MHTVRKHTKTVITLKETEEEDWEEDVEHGVNEAETECDCGRSTRIKSYIIVDERPNLQNLGDPDQVLGGGRAMR